MARVATVLLVAIVVAAEPLAAQDWTGWRGPSRDGVVAASQAPRSWPEGVTRLWDIEVGEGYASPVVSGGRVFVHSRRDPDELVTAIDVASGTILWRQQYPAPFTRNQYAVGKAKGPNSTPLVAGDRLYTLGATAVLSAWNASTGALIWRKDYSASVDTSKLFCGTATSPLIADGALIVQVGSDIQGGRVLALDPSSGAERWTWRGAGPGYASPIVIAVGGVRQIVTLTERSVEGLEAKTGRALWTVAFPDEWHENIVTPVWTGTHLIVSGVRQGTRAYTLSESKGAWQATESWANADVNMYMSSPVVADGTLYAHSQKRKGQFVALDTASGALRWATEGREGEHASVLLTPAHVVYLTNTADLVVVRRSPARFERERRYEDLASGETWTMPVLLANGMLLRDATRLVRLAWN